MVFTKSQKLFLWSLVPNPCTTSDYGGWGSIGRAVRQMGLNLEIFLPVQYSPPGEGEIAPCNTELQYKTKASTPTASNAVCSLLSHCDCHQGQFRLTAKTTTSDRICQVAAECTFRTQCCGRGWGQWSDDCHQKCGGLSTIDTGAGPCGRSYCKTCVGWLNTFTLAPTKVPLLLVAACTYTYIDTYT